MKNHIFSRVSITLVLVMVFIFASNAFGQNTGSGGYRDGYGSSRAMGQNPDNLMKYGLDTYLRETRQKLDALRADLADAEARTRLMVRTAWFDLDRARRERSLYKNRLLELSQTSLDVSTRAYESGSVSFADVINSYTGWLDVNLAGERRNSDVGVARAELERRVSVALP